MSFFRNLRSSITRGRSSSRDTTPVSRSTSRPGSIISSFNSSASSSSKRRDSIESRSDSMFNRSDTFILDDPDATPSHSNCSTLEKKSKKSKVLEKFSTFTKRKKNPTTDKAAFEHHPSDDATNTYYKWQAEGGGGNSLDYDSQNDPFNFLYEQQSSLKTLHNNGGDSSKSNSSPSPTSFDSSTYRKTKMPNDLKKQLKMLKDQDLNQQENVIQKKKVQVEEKEHEVEDEDDADEHSKADKYKTVTLNSFRRSFREKFLQQQKEAAAYNPAWFVEVKAPAAQADQKEVRDASKENRRDLLVFENENYRPDSRSPIRDLSRSKEVRTSTRRSPVKRNETFKVERLSRLDQPAAKPKPKQNTNSIHIEFKNSIMPHVPGRMVPVGVAKPIPSQLTYSNYYRRIDPSPLNNNYTNKPSAGSTMTRLNNLSPVRAPWLKSESPSRAISSNSSRLGRYQTLVQIKNVKPSQNSPVTVRPSRLSTRIQLEPSKPDRKAHIAALSPSFGKRYYSSQLLSAGSGNQVPHPLKQTYFDEAPATARITQIPSSLSSSTSGLRTRQTATAHLGGYKYHTPSPSLFGSTSSLATSAAAPTPTIATRTTPAHSVSNIHSISGNSSSNNNLSYLKQCQQQQQQQQHYQLAQQPHQLQRTRFAAAGQRRSRSPIKIPWR